MHSFDDSFSFNVMSCVVKSKPKRSKALCFPLTERLLLGESSVSNYSWGSEKCNLQPLLLMERVIVIRKWRERWELLPVKGLPLWAVMERRVMPVFTVWRIGFGFWEQTTPGCKCAWPHTGPAGEWRQSTAM